MSEGSLKFTPSMPEGEPIEKYALHNHDKMQELRDEWDKQEEEKDD